MPRHILAALAPDYAVEALIGKGGMGEVYRGREVALDRTVAIKVLPAELASEKTTVDRFVREARIAARLQHPNIVPIHAVGARNGVQFFTMDMIEGESLSGHVIRAKDTGGLSIEECRRIVTDIARALAHAHSKGVVHRDLKPSNIMIERGGRVLVMDFGLAKAAESSQLTVSGAMLGTPRYMSPEQAEGKKTGPVSDIYSLGLVYYFLLLGDDLVQASSLGAVVAMHLTADLRGKVQSQLHLPESDRDLICRMIAREPENRPPDGHEIIEALTGITALPSDHSLETTEYVIGRPNLLQRSPPPGSSPQAATPTPSTPARKKARQKMQTLLDKLERSKKGDEDR